jgi:hypothetical protein
MLDDDEEKSERKKRVPDNRWNVFFSVALIVVPSLLLILNIVSIVIFLTVDGKKTTVQHVYPPPSPVNNETTTETPCAMSGNLPDLNSCEEIFQVELSEERMIHVGVDAFVHRSRSRSHMRHGQLTTFSINTYVVPKTDPFHLMSDTYDNALAVIYFSAVGDYMKATSIAETLLLVMISQGYAATSTTRSDRLGLSQSSSFCESQGNRCDSAFTGVYARFTPDGTIGWNVAGVLSDVTFVKDMGNNGWMALAFCKLSARMKNSHAQLSSRYRQICLDLAFVVYMHRCDSGPYRGIMGRTLVEGAPGSYLSIEHNIDAYALATFALEKLDVDPSSDDHAWLTIIQTRAKEFYASMRQGNEIKIGTGLCGASNTINVGDSPPVDAVTWGILAGVTQTALGDPAITAAVLNDTVSTMFTVDTPIFEEGCGDDVEQTIPLQGSRVPCDFLHESYLYRGFQFTKKGYGPQWENSGSGAMALARLQHPNTTDALDSLVKLWKKFPTGVPAHFESEETKRTASGDYQPNTGLSWSYYKKQHAASVFWTAAAVLQREGVKGMNLFGTEDPDTAQITAPRNPFADELLDLVFSCNQKRVYSVSATDGIAVNQDLFGVSTMQTRECLPDNFQDIKSTFQTIDDCKYIQYYVDRTSEPPVVVAGEGVDHPQWGLCATILPSITEAGFQKCSNLKIVKQLSVGYDGTFSLQNLKNACYENAALSPGAPERGPLNTCLDRATKAVILWKIAEECKV